MRAHTCHAFDCTTPVPPRLLMCAHHWRMVPTDLRDAVYAHFTPGQGRTVMPSRAWIDAAKAARESVREQESASRHGEEER